MILTVPTLPDEPFYEQTSTFEGVNYGLVFRYNQREDRWYMTIQNETGTDLVRGIKLVTGGVFLTARYRTLGLPPGEFMVGAPLGQPTAPGFGELGEDRRCQLLYITSDDAILLP